jgi:ElaA protein
MNRSIPSFVCRVCETPADRAAAMAIRVEVFVDEQNVPPELEPDEFDANALHLIAVDTATDETLGTARVVNKGNAVAKIGRVAVKQNARGRGIGKALMACALDHAARRGNTVAVLDAQVTVIAFYERLGFVAEGPVFDDAGIAHRRMTRML